MAHTGSSLANFKILIVEDEESNNYLFQVMLEDLGYRPNAVMTGEEAIEVLERTEYDLILMDCQLPKVDGYQVTRYLRQREQTEQRRHTIVVGLTAHAMSGDREKCLEAGMDDYVSKPVTIEQLETTLESWLSPKSPGA